MSNKIRIRRGTDAERGTVVLDSGEPGWTTDTKKLYVGDGVTYGGIYLAHTDHQVASVESASFKDVNIAVNEAYKQATKIVLRIKDLNTFVGEGAGAVTTGDRNNFMGYQAGNYNTSGYRNNFMGYRSGRSNTTGNRNNFMGYYSGYSNTLGYYNNFMGYYAGNLNTIGNQNNYIGYYAGAANVSGNQNTSIGSYAGYYETGSNKLIIDNQQRANEADGRIKALIYGIFDAAIANQLVRLNGVLELTSIKSGSTQANAGAGANEVWKTNGHASLPDNVLMIGV